MYRSIFFVIAITFICNYGNADEYDTDLTDEDYERRLDQFADMVELKTGREAADFIGYGSFCGYGGSGKAVDAIDRCCEAHDLCYGTVEAIPKCKKNGHSNYLTEYTWHKSPSNKIICDQGQGICKRTLCKCDKDFSICGKDHIASYNSDNLKTGWRARVIQRMARVAMKNRKSIDWSSNTALFLMKWFG